MTGANDSGQQTSGPEQGDQVAAGILEDTFSAVGDQFLRLLVLRLAARLGTRYAFITECSEIAGENLVRLQTRAVWMGSKFGEDFEYSVAGTPCEKVLESRDCQVFPDAVQQAFPDDEMLAELQVRSYLGVPLLSDDFTFIGHLAAMHVEALQNIDAKLKILQVFATRAARELQRLQAERDVRRRISALLRQGGVLLPSLVPVCAWCKRVRDEEGHWDSAEAYLAKTSRVQLTHGVCPDCERLFG